MSPGPPRRRTPPAAPAPPRRTDARPPAGRRRAHQERRGEVALRHAPGAPPAAPPCGLVERQRPFRARSRRPRGARPRPWCCRSRVRMRRPTRLGPGAISAEQDLGGGGSGPASIPKRFTTPSTMIAPRPSARIGRRHGPVEPLARPRRNTSGRRCAGSRRPDHRGDHPGHGQPGQPASTAASSTAYLPKKPTSGGTPARLNISTRSASALARRGWRRMTARRSR
jgi:hypothetical protein